MSAPDRFTQLQRRQVAKARREQRETANVKLLGWLLLLAVVAVAVWRMKGWW